MKNEPFFKKSVRVFLLLMYLGIPTLMADNSVRLQAFLGGAAILNDLQNIDIEEDNVFARENNFPLKEKEGVGLMFDWAFAAKKGRLGNSLTLDYYNLKESADYCIRITNGNCLPHGTQVENWFLGYRYHFRNGPYLGLNIGISGKSERVEFVSEAGSPIARTSTIRKGASPYGINFGYSYQYPASGFTFGLHYNYAVAGEYEFDSYCSESLTTGDAGCSTEAPVGDEPSEISHNVFGLAVGWTW